MAELRWNPLSKDWVMVASNRQNRPMMPKDWCPFCKGSGKVPDEGFKVLRYPNDFPALSQNPPAPDDVANDFFQVAPSYGKCEVLLYSDQHTVTIKELPKEHLHQLANMWKDVFVDMKADKNIKYSFIFENRGDVVGVTMPHPHGQAYGYSFVPQKVKIKAENAHEHFEKTGNCLFTEMLENEKKEGKRIIFENEHFTVFIPFFSPLTYGVQMMPNRHISAIDEMTDYEINCLGETMGEVVGMYDSLFDTNFPYMMCMNNAPINGEDYSKSFQFHIEFFPPMRGATAQQFFASSETGMGAWCNPTAPEDKAEELRAAYKKFTGK